MPCGNCYGIEVGIQSCRCRFQDDATLPALAQVTLNLARNRCRQLPF